MIATLLNNLSFIDFLDFSGVSISAVVPELVTEVKLLHYIYAKERFLSFRWKNVRWSVQSTYRSTYFATNIRYMIIKF